MSPKTCHHWRGTIEKVCAAGVTFRPLAGEPAEGWAARLPCFGGEGPNKRSNGPIGTCYQYRTSTPEEVEAEAEEVEAMELSLLRHAAAGPLIQEIKSRYGPGEGGDGESECPACGGNLRWRIAAYNHHMHAKCDTDGCVAFME